MVWCKSKTRGSLIREPDSRKLANNGAVDMLFIPAGCLLGGAGIHSHPLAQCDGVGGLTDELSDTLQSSRPTSSTRRGAGFELWPEKVTD